MIFFSFRTISEGPAFKLLYYLRMRENVGKWLRKNRSPARARSAEH